MLDEIYKRNILKKKLNLTWHQFPPPSFVPPPRHILFITKERRDSFGETNLIQDLKLARCFCVPIPLTATLKDNGNNSAGKFEMLKANSCTRCAWLLLCKRALLILSRELHRPAFCISFIATIVALDDA